MNRAEQLQKQRLKLEEIFTQAETTYKDKSHHFWNEYGRQAELAHNWQYAAKFWEMATAAATTDSWAKVYEGRRTLAQSQVKVAQPASTFQRVKPQTEAGEFATKTNEETMPENNETKVEETATEAPAAATEGQEDATEPTEPQKPAETTDARFARLLAPENLHRVVGEINAQCGQTAREELYTGARNAFAQLPEKQKEEIITVMGE